jgi:spore maturation protein SpmA
VLNGIFFVLLAGGVLTAAFTGTMGKLTTDSAEAAKTAVTLAIGLVGSMTLWLGMMRILRDGGLLASLGRALAPLMRRLFPDVPPEHPAMSAMIMNLGANVLGLGNAATPFGLKAMRELDTLNPRPGVATNAMALFLAINTSGVAVLPLGVIAVRASLGAKDLAGIVLPSILATACSTLAAVLVTKLIERRAAFAPERYAGDTTDAPGAKAARGDIGGMAEAVEIAELTRPFHGPSAVLAALLFSAALVGLARHVNATSGAPLDVVRAVASDWLIPLLVLAIVCFGVAKRVKLYESFISGAKEGFDVAVRIIPFMVAILVGIAFFRASGALDALVAALAPAAGLLGIPPETLPMAFIRPLSGSGALAVMTDTMKAHGPDSLVGFIVSVMNGSTETTFYVLAVYFGSVGVRATRHTLIPCLVADVIGMTSAVYWSRLFWSGAA